MLGAVDVARTLAARLEQRRVSNVVDFERAQAKRR